MNAKGQPVSDLQAERLSWDAAATRIVHDVTLHARPGELVGLLGPNGSGKSTLLRMIYRILRPSQGRVRLDGHDVWQRSARDNARVMAVLGQETDSTFELTVREVVMMGRIPHQSPFARDSSDDLHIVHEALQRVRAAEFAERLFNTLSGGEKQRVLMARALAQQARVLVLDEPTNHLDVRHRFELMNIIRGLGLTTLAALHELQLAAHYCDRLYLLDGGALATHGTPAEVLTADNIQAIYRVPARVELDPATGRPLIRYLPDELS
jgi:iron complex transport system ATP-binding protein